STACATHSADPYALSLPDALPIFARGSGPVRAPAWCGGQALTGPTAALRSLLDDLGYATRADGAATLTDRELQAFLHGDRLDERSEGHTSELQLRETVVCRLPLAK